MMMMMMSPETPPRQWNHEKGQLNAQSKELLTTSESINSPKEINSGGGLIACTQKNKIDGKILAKERHVTVFASPSARLGFNANVIGFVVCVMR